MFEMIPNFSAAQVWCQMLHTLFETTTQDHLDLEFREAGL